MIKNFDGLITLTEFLAIDCHLFVKNADFQFRPVKSCASLLKIGAANKN